MTRDIVTSENRDEYMSRKMDEKAGKKDELAEFMERHKKQGIESYVHSGKHGIELSQVIVPKEHRGKGLGSKFMEELLAHADKEGKRIHLTPSKDYGGTVSRLKEFYKRHGFVENKGKNKDYEIRNTMYRNPLTQQ